MTLADYQFSFNGVTAGPGTEYRITAIDGLRTMPDVTSSDNPRMRRSGVYPNGDILGPKTLTIALMVVGTSDSDINASLEALEAGTLPVRPGQTAQPFVFKQPGQIQRRFAGAYPRKRAQPQDPTYIRHYQKVNLQLMCPDPAQYDDSLTTTVVAAGTGSITNAGNLESFPVVTVSGVTGDVGIENTTTGDALVLAPSTLGAIPDPCTIDLGAMTLVDGSGANRFDVVDLSAGAFPFLVPGANALLISGASTSWAWRSAWI